MLRSGGILGALLLLVGCGAKVFFLPGESDSEWGQAGRLADGRAFLGTGPRPPLQLLWEQQLDAPPVGSALFSGGLVLQLTTAPSLYAFDRDRGQRLGKRGFDADVCAPPVLVGRMLVFSTLGRDAALQGFDRQTQKMRWSLAGVFCAPLVARGDTLVAAGEEGIVRALAAGTGEELWQARIGGRVRAAPSAGGRRVYVGAADGTVVALAAGTGEELWRRRLEEGGRTRPAADQDRIFAGTAAGRVVAFDPASGEMLWRTSLDARPGPGLALGPQILAVGTVDRRVYGLDPETGSVRWAFETEGVVRGTPAATRETIFCGSSDGYLYALESASGRLQWKYRLDGPAITDVALGEGMVVIASENRTLYVFGRL